MNSQSPSRLIGLLIASVTCEIALAGEWPYGLHYAAQLGTSGNEESRSIAVDSLGNIYIAGETDGDLGGPNTGQADAFLAKFDPAGNLPWVRQLGEQEEVSAYGVTTNDANVYICGQWNGDGFVSKFSAGGEHIWTRVLKNSGEGFGRSIAVDQQANVYVTGWTSGNFGGPPSGLEDVGLAKLDPSGNTLWIRQLGTTEGDRALAVAIDTRGNAVIAGLTRGDLLGGSLGGADAFVIKFSSAGDVLWGQQFGTTINDYGYSLAVDESDNVYFTGETEGFPMGSNIFLSKLEAAGTPTWTRHFGTDDLDIATGVAVDGAGNAYVTGFTKGGLGSPYISNNFRDVFLLKVDSAGNLMWTRQVDADEEWGWSVAVDALGHAYVTGTTTGNLAGPIGGVSDAFILKFSLPPCPGDFVGYGHVDIQDLLAVIIAWGACPAAPVTCPMDIAPPGGNNSVDVDELVLVILHWGECP